MSDFHLWWMESGQIVCRGALQGVWVFQQQQASSNIVLSQYLLFCLRSVSLCPLRSPNRHSFSHPAALCLSLSSLFSALSSLPMSPAGCISVSETKQTESCVSGLVTPRSWETGSSRRSTAASSFAGHVRHSPDISRRLRSLFLYSELTLCLFGRLHGTEAKWDTLSGYEREARGMTRLVVLNHIAMSK